MEMYAVVRGDRDDADPLWRCRRPTSHDSVTGEPSVFLSSTHRSPYTSPLVSPLFPPCPPIVPLRLHPRRQGCHIVAAPRSGAVEGGAGLESGWYVSCMRDGSPTSTLAVRRSCARTSTEVVEPVRTVVRRDLVGARLEVKDLDVAIAEVHQVRATHDRDVGSVGSDVNTEDAQVRTVLTCASRSAGRVAGCPPPRLRDSTCVSSALPLKACIAACLRRTIASRSCHDSRQGASPPYEVSL